jgi:hypothetical protein
MGEWLGGLGLKGDDDKRQYAYAQVRLKTRHGPLTVVCAVPHWSLGR